jgi:hypothetical protein
LPRRFAPRNDCFIKAFTIALNGSDGKSRKFFIPLSNNFWIKIFCQKKG